MRCELRHLSLAIWQCERVPLTFNVYINNWRRMWYTSNKINQNTRTFSFGCLSTDQNITVLRNLIQRVEPINLFINGWVENTRNKILIRTFFAGYYEG